MRVFQLLAIIITIFAIGVSLSLINNYIPFDVGNTSDIVSALCNLLMAVSAVYAAFNAKSWITQSHYDHVKDFLKSMTLVNDELCKIFYNSTGGNLEFYLALHKFKPADEQIKIINLNLNPKQKIELKKRYDEFKENTINSWIEARDYSQDPDHEYTVYPDFYEYLYKLV
ncbi:hypothetical protein ACP1HW_004572 [Klebsiella pneumoniae]|nr:hypothetical protein [Klebsiella pneumoniae]HBR4373016.1 hypothetical protein [Klebsiella pneumoniae]HCK6997439.1 hypothetical protein [Klebsiella pneumoniae]HCK7008749.1 hypothetical protein [Klebsiella pneumoniae]HDT4525449.1 hypothetical protein [Klebsiella pneumoniae subsp. pneumoniae]